MLVTEKPRCSIDFTYYPATLMVTWLMVNGYMLVPIWIICGAKVGTFWCHHLGILITFSNVLGALPARLVPSLGHYFSPPATEEFDFPASLEELSRKPMLLELPILRTPTDPS